jgi:hypothetical protein
MQLICSILLTHTVHCVVLLALPPWNTITCNTIIAQLRDLYVALLTAGCVAVPIHPQLNVQTALHNASQQASAGDATTSQTRQCVHAVFWLCSIAARPGQCPVLYVRDSAVQILSWGFRYNDADV